MIQPPLKKLPICIVGSIVDKKYFGLWNAIPGLYMTDIQRITSVLQRTS